MEDNDYADSNATSQPWVKVVRMIVVVGLGKASPKSYEFPSSGILLPSSFTYVLLIPSLLYHLQPFPEGQTLGSSINFIFLVVGYLNFDFNSIFIYMYS